MLIKPLSLTLCIYLASSGLQCPSTAAGVALHSNVPLPKGKAPSLSCVIGPKETQAAKEHSLTFRSSLGTTKTPCHRSQCKNSGFFPILPY